MNERERFVYLVRIIVITFKEDTKNGLVHMKIFLQLEEPLLQRRSKGNNDEGSNNASEDEAEYVRKE